MLDARRQLSAGEAFAAEHAHFRADEYPATLRDAASAAQRMLENKVPGGVTNAAQLLEIGPHYRAFHTTGRSVRPRQWADDFLDSEPMHRLVRQFASAVLALLWATSAVAAWTIAPNLRDRAWIDSDGQELRMSSLRSPLIVMTMAYTACRKVCGTTTLVLSDIQRRLDTMKIEADFVVVSYDPANDSPAEWRDYRSRRGLARSNWHFLTGDADTTRTLARGLDLSFWTYHDHIVHDFRILLFDAQWQMVGEVDWAHIDQLESILTKVPAAPRSVRPQP